MKKKTLSPNDLGKNFLTDQCQKIKIDDLVKKAGQKIKHTLIKSELELHGQKLQLTQAATGFNGLRFWFICPLCNRKVGIIYKYPFNEKLGCRKCLRLKYRKQRYKGMIEEQI
jgi:predicted GNAT family acetyltransferase